MDIGEGVVLLLLSIDACRGSRRPKLAGGCPYTKKERRRVVVVALLLRAGEDRRRWGSIVDAHRGREQESLLAVRCWHTITEEEG